MGSGRPLNPKVNSYTLHTPYFLWKMQAGLESGVVFDKHSETGLSIWNNTCSCLQPWSPTSNEIVKGYPRPPLEQGIPVATLVGYYDPELKFRSYIYPALHGAYGNTFKQSSQAEITAIECYATSICYARITNHNGKILKYALKGARKIKGEMNKFHINVNEAFQPKSISIYCNNENIAERMITPPTKKLSYSVNGRNL